MSNECTPTTAAREALSDPAEQSAELSGGGLTAINMPAVLSFDVEEHDRIEAAAGLEVAPVLKAEYQQRMYRVLDWLLEKLSENKIPATFFIVGQIARDAPALIRSIVEAGHEVASHGWDHRRVQTMTAETFREDLRKSKATLEQACGSAVLGYRAPTFSVVRKTAWALDIMSEIGLVYDSSIYPVHHDRYGIADAPRGPFLARGMHNEILELPPATVRIAGVNFPVGGGGYFRILPWPLMKLALAHSRRDKRSGATVLYFHPWEFDPDQPQLPLKHLNRFRTYVGIRHTQSRLERLLSGYQFVRAIDLARQLLKGRERLPGFRPTL
jgi:polysaccharide deacetylase family protein (PEP-CTERM system associated)